MLEASGEESEAEFDLGVVAQLLSHAPDDAAAAAAAAAGVGIEPVRGRRRAAGAAGRAAGARAGAAGDRRRALDRPGLRRVRCCSRAGVCTPTRVRADRHATRWRRARRRKLVAFPGRCRAGAADPLGGLDGREVRSFAGSLVRRPLSRAAGRAPARHTDGHPLYIRALVDELGEDSLASEHGPLPAPHSFAATVLARLATLSPQARDLAAAAAVVGARCRVELAVAAAGVGDSLEALDEVLDAGVLVVVPGRLPSEVAVLAPAHARGGLRRPSRSAAGAPCIWPSPS